MKTKLLQNRVAESGLTLPLLVVYGIAVWLLAGLIAHQWWGQLACFAATVYLMVELSNSNALLRVRSRMVSSTFIVLSCAACPLFSSLPGSIAQLCFTCATIILFHTYQDKQAPGWTFYAFLCIGLSSFAFVQTLYFVPLIWLLMGTHLQSLSWRTWLGSIIGLLTPYWIGALWLIYQQDFSLVGRHFTALAELPFPGSYASLTVNQIAVFAFVTLLAIISILHFWNRSFEDKIRIRQLYGYFTIICLTCIGLLVLYPQHYDELMRIAIIMASPLAAHYFTLTSSRFTNISFCVAVTIAFLLMLLGLFDPSIDACRTFFQDPWSGLLTF